MNANVAIQILWLPFPDIDELQMLSKSRNGKKMIWGTGVEVR